MFHLSLRTINKSNVTSTRNKRLKRDNDRRTDYTQTAEITVIVVYAHNRLWINISSMIKYMYIISRYLHDFIREKKFAICAVENSFEVVCFDVIGAFKSYPILFICIWKCFCISPREEFIFWRKKIREKFFITREERRNDYTRNL